MNKVIIVTAPSGAGKTTLVKKLLAEFSQLAFSVSATTRAQREGETDGKDYYFISENDFRNKIAAGDFLEYEEVYKGTIYGTLKAEVERLWAENKIVVFDIDVQGALNIKRILGTQALSIFIKPPSVEVLEQRLKDRNTETIEKIQMRIHKAHEELKYDTAFDTYIVNADIDAAYSELREKVLTFSLK